MEYLKLKEDAHLVDLTRSKVTVETLTETKITCATEEKVSSFSFEHSFRSLMDWFRRFMPRHENYSRQGAPSVSYIYS